MLPAPAPLFPPLALAAGIACVAGAAALAHCAVLTALFRHSRTGLNSILIQLTVADIILIGTTIGPELWSINSRTWLFGKTGCIAYSGLSVFNSTLSTYLVIAVALHVLTTIRLEETVAQRRIKRYRDVDEEMRSSQHSLVANSDSSTPPRTMNVDYRLANIRLPVALPVCFVWILGLSLSIPEFTLATTVQEGISIVCSLDSSHLFNVYALLAVFNLFLPLFIISSTCVFVVRQLLKKKTSGVDNNESVALLRLSLWLMCVQVLLCAPRSAIRAYSVYSATSNSDIENVSHVLQRSESFTIVNLALSSAYITATLIRPLLCIITLPQIRKYFIFSISSDTAE